MNNTTLHAFFSQRAVNAGEKTALYRTDGNKTVECTLVHDQPTPPPNYFKDTVYLGVVTNYLGAGPGLKRR